MWYCLQLKCHRKHCWVQLSRARAKMFNKKIPYHHHHRLWYLINLLLFTQKINDSAREHCESKALEHKKSIKIFSGLIDRNQMFINTANAIELNYSLFPTKVTNCMRHRTTEKRFWIFCSWIRLINHVTTFLERFYARQESTTKLNSAIEKLRHFFGTFDSLRCETEYVVLLCFFCRLLLTYENENELKQKASQSWKLIWTTELSRIGNDLDATLYIVQRGKHQVHMWRTRR